MIEVVTTCLGAKTIVWFDKQRWTNTFTNILEWHVLMVTLSLGKMWKHTKGNEPLFTKKTMMYNKYLLW
jgi:hypothetical protein